MRRGWKIVIAVVAALIVLLGLNAVSVDHETEAAEVTEPDGRILQLPGAKLQVVERGPRTGSPIVLIHCFTCAIDWWDAVIPRLARDHRVVAVDLLGHGGSEKPRDGYSIPNQADLVAQALGRLGVRDATVVGHSLGGSVTVALAQQSPQLVDRVVIIDTGPTHEGGDLGLMAKLAFSPVIGEFLWRIKPDFAVKQGLEVAFAPGFEVPDAFVEDLKAMTFSSYDNAARGSEDYSGEKPLDQRMRETGKPLLVIMGAEEQIIDDPGARLAEYRETVPGSRTKLLPGVGHSPNVEAPAETARLVLAFAAAQEAAARRASRAEMQDRVQKSQAVRGPS
jgi:pimeloyl-ACP methyl ester carboxylesterase